MSDGSVSPDRLFIFGPTGVGEISVTTEFKDCYPSVEVFISDKQYTWNPINLFTLLKCSFFQVRLH